MTDLNLFMQGMQQQKMAEARRRLWELLAETGMRITLIQHDGPRIVLTDDKSGSYLDLDDGTWH